MEAALLQSPHVIQKLESKNDTALSTFLWGLKKSRKEIPKLTWLVLKVFPGYLNIKATIK